MKNLFISYELAMIAKEKGFDEPCLSCYLDNKNLIEDDYYSISQPCLNHNNKPDCPASPMYQQIIDWLREKHNIFLYPIPTIVNKRYQWNIATKQGTASYSGDYYEALNKAIETALDLI